MAHDKTSNDGPEELKTDDITTDRAVPLDFLRGLAEIVKQENLSEISIEENGLRLTLKAPSAIPPAPQMVDGGAAPVYMMQPEADEWEEDEAPATAAAPQKPDATPIVSPMVGVFYRSQTPDDPPFVSVGDTVEVGQTIGLVEAMKTFNEITSEIEGTVIEIPVQNGALVETGSPLVLVKKV